MNCFELAFAIGLSCEFIKNGGVKVTYKNGAQVQLTKYFAMATRTARTETQNLVVLDDAKRLGTDYVYLAPCTSPCKTCAALGNRVYCISGKDKSYPSVYGVLFKNGYTCIHPHCRCVLRPFFIQDHSKEEMQKLQEDSNRSLDLDPRTEQQRQAYQDSQAFNHNQWATQLEYEKMQSIYGHNAPYKTLGGLRRGKTVASENYQQTHKMVVDKAQFERWQKVIGAEKMPKDLAKFQKIKYNDTVAFKALHDSVIIARENIKIRNNPKLLRIEVGKQQKHIKGTNNYIEGKSYFVPKLSLDDIQQLIREAATTGTRVVTKSGKVSNKETVKYDKVIGYCYDNSGKILPTQVGKIHYSKKGVHLVPTLRRFD